MIVDCHGHAGKGDASLAHIDDNGRIRIGLRDREPLFL
jgi:hypothetical protein